MEKHSWAVRWLHWVNFPLLLVMVWSGLMIYWSWQPYSIGAWHFFPAGFFSALGLQHRLAEGIAIHFTFMWFFALNGMAYAAYCLVSGEWRALVNDGKYSIAQRIAYCAVLLMGFGLLVTGLAIHKPIQVAWLTALLGGYEWARAEHFTLTLGVLVFFLVHMLQGSRAGWKNFRSMVVGCE